MNYEVTYRDSDGNDITTMFSVKKPLIGNILLLNHKNCEVTHVAVYPDMSGVKKVYAYVIEVTNENE